MDKITKCGKGHSRDMYGYQIVGGMWGCRACRSEDAIARHKAKREAQRLRN